VSRAIESERGLLASVLSNPAALEVARLALDGSEFYSPKHELLYAVCCDLADAKVTPNGINVIAELGKRRKLSQFNNGTDVTDLLSAGSFGSGDVRYHVARIREAAQVRSVRQSYDRLGQMLGQFEDDGDADQLFMNVAGQTIALELAIDATALDAPVPGLQTWQKFTADTGRPRWIVPGLIRANDTILILGAPGAGKSFLSRQVAMCLAAGIHPFYLTKIDPVRTLLVDLENAPDQVAEEAGHLLTKVQLLGDLADRGHIYPHPEGFNLRKRADAMLLERLIVQAQPQVLCMGSLYNAYRRGRDDWDTAAEDVQAVLKGLRAKYGLGLWLEHHMPRKDGDKHTGTPYGGTAWERWPTHGRVLTEVGDGDTAVYLLERTFRGDRGKRTLPPALTRGGELMWTAHYDALEVKRLTNIARGAKAEADF